MKHKTLAVLVLVGLIGVSAFASPALPKTYQVTGPILAMTPDIITVKKGEETWELGRDASTKITGTPKVGNTVTIMYRMTATSIEVKPARGK